MTLSARVMAAMVALVLLTAAAIGVLTYRSIAALVLPRALERMDTHVRLLALELEASVRGARADVLGFRSAVAVEGIVRATLAGGTHPGDGITAEQWRDRLARRFVAELVAKPSYAQFRVIGVADAGREILRVDRSGPGGAIRIVPPAEFQQKGDRDYFQRAIRLRPSDVEVSPVELNQEHGIIETPHVPVIRAAAAIHAPDSRSFGIVIINVDLRPAFARIRAAAIPGGQVYVVNERGDYLVHPDPAREFGFELGRPARLQDDFPVLALSGTEEPRVIADRSGEQFGVALASVLLAQGPRITLAQAVPYRQLVAATSAVRDSSLIAGLAAAAGAIIVAFFVTRSLTRPLVQMTRAVEAFGRGEQAAAPTGASGEIGVLAQSFARMQADMREKTDRLEQEVEERRRIIDTALDAFVQMDEHGIIVEWNPQAQAVFGWSRAEALGRALAELIVPPRHRDAHQRGLAHFLETGESAILGKRLEIEAQRREGGEIRVELTVTALRRRDGHVFNGFIRDITEKLAAEAQLRQSQKIDAVGQLTGGVAHDFNNILTVITGTIEILAGGVADRPRLATIAKMIEDAAARGAELTRQLLAFARRQPLQPRELDVNALVVDAARLLRPTLGEQIEIESMLEEDAWPAMADPAQLSTALVNLALNARDAMPGGGKLTLETGNTILDDAYAAANPDIRPGPYVLIGVSDTGHGIPAAIRDKVFEPFFTTKEIGRGTGLGLSMVYGFVKQSGGHVKIYSEEGHGTSVKIYLPRAQALADAPVEGAPPSSAQGGGECILVVEDDELVRDYVVTQLASLGYATHAAANGAEALAFVESGGAFDLLFTDVIMPGGMNGRQLADEVARRRPGVKVLYTSGYTENAIVHHGRLDPGVALLNKPYRKSDLAGKLREVLATPSDKVA